MVVGYIQPQNVKAMPKKQEMQPASGKTSFESLMNDRINKENAQRPLDTKDKEPKDDFKELEKDDKRDALDQAMAALAEKANTPVEKAPDVVIALTAEQVSAEQLAIQLAQPTQPAQQTANIQTDGAIKAAEDLIVPQENPKLQDGNGKTDVSSSLENGDDLNSEPQMKIPFEKILESGQDVKIPVVNTQTKTEGAAVDTKGDSLTDVNKAATQTIGSSQEKNATAEETISVIPQQATVKTLDPNNVNIKVGETVDTKSEVFAQDFADKVVFKINQDVKEFQIELNPMDMGKVSIKVVFAAEKAFVSLSCENAKTQSLLAQSSDTIRSIIQQNVGSETVVVVQEQQPQQNYQQQQQERQEKQEQEQQSRPQQKMSDDSLTFVNQLRLGLVDINSRL